MRSATFIYTCCKSGNILVELIRHSISICIDYVGSTVPSTRHDFFISVVLFKYKLCGLNTI